MMPLDTFLCLLSSQYSDARDFPLIITNHQMDSVLVTVLIDFQLYSQLVVLTHHHESSSRTVVHIDSTNIAHLMDLSVEGSPQPWLSVRCTVCWPLPRPDESSARLRDSLVDDDSVLPSKSGPLGINQPLCSTKNVRTFSMNQWSLASNVEPVTN